ncbi:MAG: sugar transferase [Litoreibacter sp.]|nr:sugar transferase [Litoreibacter sp.]
MAMPAVLPLIAVFTVLGMLDGANPFYFQSRVGKDNRIFRMWKLRSMVPDADFQLARLLERDPSAKAEWSISQKLKKDPRVTAFGRFIRKFSIDELPQLWNVLRGDMSLVGPRPMMPEQRALYPGQAYYHFRPGITGLWQVSQRNEGSFASRAEFDQDYAETISLKTDAWILFSTVGVVFKGTGC